MKSAVSVLSLTSSFSAQFASDLFKAAKKGDASTVSSLIHQVNSTALSLVSAAPPSERQEKSAELVASYLSKIRDQSSQQRETLLGAAALAGQINVMQLLLTYKADPLGADEKGNSTLHKAGEGGNLLAALILLDRMQANDRSLSVTELPNLDGETPDMVAAVSGASDICRAFTVFREMQHDAELKQLGSNLAAPDLAGGHRAGPGTGDLLTCVDLAVQAPSPAAASTAALLRRFAVGTPLVPNLFQRIPEDQDKLQKMVDRVCSGLHMAEDMLMRKTKWNSSDPALDPALRSFVATAELRSQWQRLREEALKSPGNEGLESALEEFWQTHLTAESMVVTIRTAMGDTFQLLLTALWLYTREAWLRHVLDALATVLHAASVRPEYNEGATGSTGPGLVWSSADLPPAFQIVVPFVDALAPCMQLVQAALGWFEEANIRHTAATYRPLSLPMLGLQKLVDRYISLRRNGDGTQEVPWESGQPKKLESGSWISLGAGSFFSSLSQRSMAIRRLARTRCNALLIIRPEEIKPSYPKHMSLRGSSVDDTLFPLETVFRIGRITRTVSSDLDTDGTAAMQGANSRWPVMIIEVYAADRHLEAMELLHRRRELGQGELVSKLEEWARSAPPDQEPERLFEAGELLAKVGGDKSGADGKASQLLAEAASAAEAAHQVDLAAQALFAKARLPSTAAGTKEQECRKAYSLLQKAYGEGKEECLRAKSIAQEMGVSL